jgi:hypothetical protein
MRLRHALFLLTVLAIPAQAAPPVLKAKVADPVLEELMGGCSLKCSFRWTVETVSTPGQPTRPVTTLNDESPVTAWLAEMPNGAAPASLRLRMPKKIPAEMEGEVPLYGVEIINGHWKSDEDWKRWGRVKRARLSYNGRVLGEVVFADSRRWQRLTFDDIMIRSGDFLTLDILEIYPGTGGGVALSEIVLSGGH